MTENQDRRQFWRAVFNSTVRLTTDSGTVGAALVDISLKGALVAVPSDWHGKSNEPCHIKLSLAEGVVIAMWGKVAHIQGRHVGIRCDTIDLDSITHLRRLVELNSGDPEMLEQEFQSLVEL